MNTLPIELVQDIIIKSDNLIYALTLNDSYIYDNIIKKLVSCNFDDLFIQNNIPLLIKHLDYNIFDILQKNNDFNGIIDNFAVILNNDTTLSYNFLCIVLEHRDSYKYFKYFYTANVNFLISHNNVNKILKSCNLDIIKFLLLNNYFFNNTKKHDLKTYYIGNEYKILKYNYKDDLNSALSYFSYNPCFFTTACCLSNLEIITYIYNYIDRYRDSKHFIRNLFIKIHNFINLYYPKNIEIITFLQSKINNKIVIPLKEHSRFKTITLRCLNPDTNSNTDIFLENYINFFSSKYLTFINYSIKFPNICIQNNCKYPVLCPICKLCHNCSNLNYICNCKSRCFLCNSKMYTTELVYSNPLNSKNNFTGICYPCLEDFD